VHFDKISLDATPTSLTSSASQIASGGNWKTSLTLINLSAAQNPVKIWPAILNDRVRPEVDVRRIYPNQIKAACTSVALEMACRKTYPLGDGSASVASGANLLVTRPWTARRLLETARIENRRAGSPRVVAQRLLMSANPGLGVRGSKTGFLESGSATPTTKPLCGS
jgi:hypothetical protein